MNKNEIIESVITTILKNINCDELDSVFDKIENSEVSKDVIIKSFKSVLRSIERKNENFECLIKRLSNEKFSDSMIHNLIAEKIKPLLASGEKEAILLALKIIENIDISDKLKLDVIKTLIQDINENDFQDDYLEFVKKMKKMK